jgi:hypothetical protein
MFIFKNIATKIKLGLLLVIIAGDFFGAVFADNDQEYAVRAGLTSNLARFTSWPNTGSQYLNLCLVGNPVLEEAFTNLNGKTVGDKLLQVRYLARFSNLGACQILYISDLDNNKLLLLLNEIKSLPILTIGEDAHFIRNGGMVSIQIINGKVGITVNLKATKSSNLNISARVLKLATVVQ